VLKAYLGEAGAADVLALVAGVAHHHGHVAHFHHGLGDQLDGGEQPVDVVGAVHQHLQLAAALAPGLQELVGVLEVVVVAGGDRGITADDGGDDLAVGKGVAVMHRDDAHGVVVALDDHRLEAFAVLDDGKHLLEGDLLALVQGQVEHVVFGDDHELGQVDGIGAFAQDHALGPLLAAAAHPAGHVLEIVGGGVAGDGLGGGQILAVPGEHVADLALGDGDQGHLVDAVLAGHEEVPAAAQDLRLEAGFPGQGDEPGLHRAPAADQLFHDAHPVVGDVDDAHRHHHQDQQDQQRYADHAIVQTYRQIHFSLLGYSTS
jgi:hypothetical protein